MTTEWICVCGKVEADGKTCRFGATHSAPAFRRTDDEARQIEREHMDRELGL